MSAGSTWTDRMLERDEPSSTRCCSSIARACATWSVNGADGTLALATV